MQGLCCWEKLYVSHSWGLKDSLNVEQGRQWNESGWVEIKTYDNLHDFDEGGVRAGQQDGGGGGGGNKYFCLSLPPLPRSTLTLHQTWLVE